MIIESPAFKDNDFIPKEYTCDGENLSPPFNIFGIPSNAATLAIIMDDPDPPNGTFVHWIAWNIDPKTTTFLEDQRLDVQGRNGFGIDAYRGPCPPKGKPHHYFFKLYALDNALQLPQGSSKEDVLDAMKGHILAEAEIVGLYQR